MSSARGTFLHSAVDVCHVSTTFNRRSGSGRRTLAIAEHCQRRGISTALVFGPDNDMGGYTRAGNHCGDPDSAQAVELGI